MASLDSLTDGEIRVKLTELGCPVGPVTATTRKVLLKKLKTLLESSGSAAKGNIQYDPNCSITQFSSGEESDESSARATRRRSMPPPKSTKSPRRKSPGPLANSSFVDQTTRNVPSTEESFSSLRRPGRYSTGATLSEFTSRTTTTRSADFINNDPDTDRLSRGITNSHGSHDAYTTGSSTPPRFSTGSSYLSSGINDGIRSRFQATSPITNFSQSPANTSFKSNQPYSSDFARRLSLSTSRVTSATTNISPKLLDVKESDDEDNGSVPVYSKFSQSNVKGSPASQMRLNGRVLSQERWFQFDTPISAVLVGVLFLFFLIIGFTYINMHTPDTNSVTSTDLKFPFCSMLEVGARPGVNCIKDADVSRLTKMFRVVHKELFERLANDRCTGQALEPLTDHQVIQLIMDKAKESSIYDVESDIPNLKLLISVNPDWKLMNTPNGIALKDPPSSMVCFIYEKLMMATSWMLKLAFIVLVVFVLYRAVRWWMWRNARYNDEVYRLVTSILEIVSSKAALDPNSFVPISHVRDQLIAPKDRLRLSKLWNDAVTVLESDSRLRCEVQQVEGEEFAVWRWLASPLSPSKRKVWQGQAFETVEGSVNSLPESPTQYLKIRHMFDPAMEEGDEWMMTVIDAILEKCGEAKILHIVVDKQSREGCVYLKCASQVDAGIAYRALHGSWFDSKLVTVKYIREKRYLERFPDSAQSVQPLRPSNDKKNSLQ